MEVGLLLVNQPHVGPSKEDRTRLDAACAEYEASQRLNADRPVGEATWVNSCAAAAMPLRPRRSFARAFGLSQPPRLSASI